MPQGSIPDALLDLLGTVQGGVEEAIWRRRQGSLADIPTESERTKAVIFDVPLG